MPIDRNAFLREMAILAELFNRPMLSDPLIARYKAVLDTQLTTQQFEHAAATIFAQDSFFPPPIRFIHAAKGDPAQTARQEWDALLEHARKGDLAPLTEPGKAALKAIGGWTAIAYADEFRLSSLRKQFLESYTDKPTDQALVEVPA